MTPKKALVVDDSRSARYSLRKTLERLNVSVDCVESGETALSYLESATQEALPDIIFMDNLMPGMNGFRTSESIHQEQRWEHIPIVMCTATQGTVDFSQCQASGAVGLLPKPATIGQIKALLADLAKTGIAYPEKTALHTANGSTAAKETEHTAQTSLIDGSVASAHDDPAAHATFHSADVIANGAPSPLQTEKSPPVLNFDTPAHTAQNDEKTTADTQKDTTSAQSVFPAHSRTAAEASLESLIDRVQAQLKGIEPRLMSLESAKQTLDRAIQQRVEEMRDQLAQYMRALIKDTVTCGGDTWSLDDATREQLEQHVAAQAQDILDERLQTQIETLSQKLQDDLNAQTRYMEHRLLGEALNTEQIVEQATEAAKLAVESELKAMSERGAGALDLDSDSPAAANNCLKRRNTPPPNTPRKPSAITSLAYNTNSHRPRKLSWIAP